MPPGKSKYFFSFGGEKAEAEVARDKPKVKEAQAKEIKGIRCTEIDFDTGLFEEYTMPSFRLTRFNFVTGAKHSQILDPDTYLPVRALKVVVPRMSDRLYVRDSKLRPKTPWSLPMSVFAEWDTVDRLVECFEFDWAQIKLPKMEEKELQEVKLALWNCYGVIKETYRYFSAHGASSNLAQIPLNSYTEYVKGIKLVDGREVKFAASDTEFISITKRAKKTALVPGNALIRSQFVEILARLALRRYEQGSKQQAI